MDIRLPILRHFECALLTVLCAYPGTAIGGIDVCDQPVTMSEPRLYIILSTTTAQDLWLNS